MIAFQSRQEQLKAANLMLVGFLAVFLSSGVFLAWGKIAGNFRISLAGYALLSGGLTGGAISLLTRREISQAIQREEEADAREEEAYTQGRAEGKAEEEARALALLESHKTDWERETQSAIDTLKNIHKEALEAAIDATSEEWQKAISEKESLIETLYLALEEHRKKEEEVKEKERSLRYKQQELQGVRDNINQDKLTLAREEGYRENLRNSLMEKDRAIDDLTEELRRLQEIAQDEIQASKTTYYQLGQEQVSEAYERQVEKLRIANQKLTLQLKELQAYKEMDRVLPTLKSLLVNGKKPLLKPTFITGSQGSGKALSAANVVDSWQLGAGNAIPFVLDVSEGGSPDSSWHHLGIPNTSDRELFLEVARSLFNQLDPSSSLPLRNSREKYAESPPIVLLVDEVMTAFDGWEADKINELVSIFEAIESRGSKRKVFIILMAIDSQIQNLSAQPKKGAKIKLINSGKVRNYLRILLNDSLIAHASEEELKANLGLQKYLNVYGGSHFVSAVEWVDGKGKFLKPIKHPSHHGHLLTETVPSQGVKLVSLAPCPGWFPNSARAIYEQYLKVGENDRDCDSLEGESYPVPQKSDARIGGADSSTVSDQQPSELLSIKGSRGVDEHQHASTQKVNVVCPYCGGVDIVKVGKYKQKQRFRCKNSNCKKTFTEASV